MYLIVLHWSKLLSVEEEEEDESLLKEKLRLRQSIASKDAIKCPLCYFEMGDVNLLKEHMKVGTQMDRISAITFIITCLIRNQ